MKTQTIDGKLYKNMMIAARQTLLDQQELINALNVFPVPDGDTGTNMSLTLESAIKELQKEESESLDELADAVANGSLMGARGNSGVILSQLISGFAKGLKEQDHLTAQVFTEALRLGVLAAYKAVSNPVEGTILTVSRESVEDLNPSDDMDLSEVLEIIIQKGRESLNRTPELLPILKQSGVVDAGGMGYLVFLSGMQMYLKGEEIELMSDLLADMEKHKSKGSGTTIDFPTDVDFDHQDINFQYCTELLLQLEREEDFPEEPAKDYLQSFGDSVLVIASEGIVKVHTHTNEPWKVLEYFGNFGSLNDIKIDNMKAQSETYHQKDEKDLAIIAVSYGEGFAAIFKSLGVDHIISGGQTMNPSTEDILEAIKKINAKSYIILPNNKNIILAAEQAAKISEKNLLVIYSKTIPQGITSLMSYHPEIAAEENQAAMNESLAYVKSIEITKAVRDTTLNGIDIKKGQYISIADGKILLTRADLKETVSESIAKEIDEDSEIITVYYGEDLSEEEAEELLNELADLYEDIDFELHNGGQPLYPYIISVE